MKKSMNLESFKVTSFTTSIKKEKILGGGSVLTQYTCPPSNPYDCPGTSQFDS